MEKNLKQILSEMKKLMEYNPSIGKIISEQDPDFEIDPRLGPQKSDRLGKGGTFDRQQKELTRKGVKSTDGYFYRQSFNEHKGYFDNNMMLGECFDIINFTTNDNALTSMSIPKDKIFKDGIGYYIKGKTNAYGDSRDIRIYLPKDDFFRNLNGVVKSFIAYQTCNDQKRKQGGRKYNLVYQLTDPSKAVINQIIDGNGIQIIDDEVSRGWTISQFGGGQSGYFRSKSEEYDDVIGGDPSLKGSLLPQDFSEFSLENYAEEYGRSDFDIWYDSGWGTAVSIGVAILASIVTGGIAGAVGLTSRVAILGAELAGELIIAIPEAIYLKNRGMNSSAAMVLIFSLIPVLNASGFAKKVTGLLTDKEISDLIKKVSQNAEQGAFKTPGDVKAWIKGLDDKTRKFVEETLQNGSDALKQVNKEVLVKDINDGLKKIINEVRTNKVVTKEIAESADKLFADYAKSYASTFKLIGLDIAATIASMPVIFTLIKDDEEYKKDPQGFLERIKKNVEKMNANLQQEKVDEQSKLISELEAKAKSGDANAAKEYVKLLRDLSNLDLAKNADDMESTYMKGFLQQTIIDLQVIYSEYIKSKNKENAQEFINILDNVIPGAKNEVYEGLLKPCESTASTNFTTKDQACNFLKWVKTNHPEFTYYWNNMKIVGVEDCDDVMRTIQPEWYLINDCEIREAYLKYKDEYVKSTTTTQTTTQSTTEPITTGLPPKKQVTTQTTQTTTEPITMGLPPKKQK